MQEQPLGTGDAVRSAREAVGSGAESVLVLSGDTPLLTTELLQELVDDAPAASRRPRPCSRSSPRTSAPTAASSAAPTAPSQAIVEAADATPEQLELRECNSSIYVFQADALWPALERLEPAERAGRALPDRRRARPRRAAASASPSTSPPIRPRREGVNTRVELAAAAAALRDRINRAHMLAGRHDRRPRDDLDRARRRARGGRRSIHPFTVLRGATRVAAGRGDRPARRRRSTPRSAPSALVGPFCYLRPGTVLGPRAKAGTFVEIKNSTDRRRDEGAAPLLHRRRGDR